MVSRSGEESGTREAMQSRFPFLDSERTEKLREYVKLAMTWNAKIQFTATKDPEVFWERHVCDCLVLVEKMNDIHFTKTVRVVDVGSGGGLPSVVIAIAKPDWDVVAVEPVHKKHSFLAQCRRALGLTNFSSHALRDSELLERPDFVPFDAAVSRAVWDVPTWIERGRRLVNSSGWVLAMEGKEQRAAGLPDRAQRHLYELADKRERAILCVPALEEGP